MADLDARNKKQSLQLKEMETEVNALQGEMMDLEYLGQDVREMLDSDSFGAQPGTADREKPQPSRGGGRDDPATDRLNMSTIGGLFTDSDSIRERREEWEGTYREVTDLTNELLAKVDTVEEDMAQLKKDVAVKKDYQESRPTGFPAAGRITSGFGTRRSPFSGRSELHPGLDIAAGYGTAAVATGKGVVVSAGYRAGYGNTVVIRHNFGFQTLYGHNSSITVKTGDHVTRGQVIARVGSTGASTGPHLHYEVLINGVRVNPSPYL